MPDAKTLIPSKTVAYHALRVLLGTLILATGVGKALDVPGFAAVVATYRLGLPERALFPLALSVTAIELALGAWLLHGRHVAAAAKLSIALNVGYFCLLSAALWRGLELQNCGCFGVYLARPLRWYSPLEDGALIAASYALLALARRRS